MANRYKDLQKLQSQINRPISRQLNNLDRNFADKLIQQVSALSVNLPNNILKGLQAEYERHVDHDGRYPNRNPDTGEHLVHNEETAEQFGKKVGDPVYIPEQDENGNVIRDPETGKIKEMQHEYHGDEHKAANAQLKAEDDIRSAKHSDEINSITNHHTNEDVDHLTEHPVFDSNSADYQAHQTPFQYANGSTEWTPQLENDIVTKHTSALNEEFGEGNWTQADIERKRKEAGEPPGPPPQRKTAGPPLQWAGPVSGWVKPETVADKGVYWLNNLSRGFDKGTVLDNLHQLQDANGENFLTMQGSAAKNLGVRGIVTDEGKGFNGSNVILTHAKPITNEHGNKTNENVHNFTTNNGAAQNLNTLTNTADNIVNTAPTKHESLEHTGLVAYDPNQKTSRLSSFKQTGGMSGALDRFKAATLPAKLGGGKLQDQVVRQTPEGKNFVSSPHIKPAVTTTNREGQSIEPKPILGRVKSTATGAATGAAIGAAAAGPLGGLAGGVAGGALGALRSFIGRSKKE